VDKESKKIIFLSIGIVLIIALLIGISIISVDVIFLNENYDYYCSTDFKFCEMQEKELGLKRFFIETIYCDETPEICRENNITVFPVWVNKNSEQHIGVFTIKELEALNCDEACGW